jgi:hypothetical protein
MDDCYQEYLDLIKEAEQNNLTCILIFRPDAREDDGTGPSIPDMILSTTSDPAVIEALLGPQAEE